MPLGQNKSNFNYNLDEKRVLNFENVVDDSDNVKQDMSIDVYGRQQDDEPEKAEPDTSDVKVFIATLVHCSCIAVSTAIGHCSTWHILSEQLMSACTGCTMHAMLGALGCSQMLPALQCRSLQKQKTKWMLCCQHDQRVSPTCA